MRGCSQNKKREKGGKVTSKSRLGKYECAFCHEKGHWKKDCHKLKKKIRARLCLMHVSLSVGGDSSNSEFCLVSHQTIAGFDE